MAESTKFVCVGGGLASGSAIQTLIEEGVPGSDILLISAENNLPYHRPSLSKGYLTGKESQDILWVEHEDFYRRHGVGLKLGTRVTQIHPRELQLETDAGERISFEQLLIATGATPRRLTTPGSDADNIFYLRTIADSDAIKQAAQSGREAVIIGAGFIGMEVAASLRSLGLDVTVIHRGLQILDRFAAPPLAQFLHDYLTAHGVKIRYEESLDHYLTEDRRVRGVVTDKGIHLPADLVVVGIGVELLLDCVKQTSIRIDNGILTDEELQTSVPGIFAAGDIVNFPDPIFGGKRRRIEHWDHAQASGKAAALNMLGRKQDFNHLSYFFSDLFDLSFELWGDTDAPNETVFYGSLQKNTAACWYLRGGAVSAYFSLNRPDEEKEEAQRLIRTQQPISKAEIEERYAKV